MWEKDISNLVPNRSAALEQLQYIWGSSARSGNAVNPWLKNAIAAAGNLQILSSSPGGGYHIVAADHWLLLISALGFLPLIDNYAICDGEYWIDHIRWAEADHLVLFDEIYLTRYTGTVICHFSGDKLSFTVRVNQRRS